MEPSDAPPVVALVVACNPGPWFEETLRALAAQDYPDLALLVLDVGSKGDLAARVAAVAPGAFVRRIEGSPGFAASADSALGMVEGASHLVICHDDIAPDPDVVRRLVEEAFRSNAGIVAPKYVAWDAPGQLLCVGLDVDKGGAPRNRIDLGEVDHGQHDTVRDVFVAPGGCVLVRADLFEALGGFDPEILAFGEDIELSWRAQVAGARVVVAPQARVRHREALASGERPLPQRRLTVYGLQRRHELRSMLACYGPVHLVRVVPQVAALSIVEIFVAALLGHRDRSRAIVRAWGWNFRNARSLRARRSALHGIRALPDGEVRRLQARGSARIARAGRAWLARHPEESLRAWLAREDAAAPALAPSLAGPAAGAGELAGVADRRRGRRRGRLNQLPPASLRVRTTTWAVACAVLLIGSRSILFGHLPLIGQLVPGPGAFTLISRFVGGRGGAVPGTGFAALSSRSPALVLLGLAGTVLAGSTSLLERLLVLGCLPVGLVGAARLSAPLSSRWGRLVGMVVYACLPLPYDALAAGRLDVLVAYAAAPWFLARLARSTGLVPWPGRGRIPEASAPAAVAGRAVATQRRDVRAGRRHTATRIHSDRWRATLPGQAVAFGVLEALTVPFAPPIALAVLVAAVAVAGTTVAAGGMRAALRPAGVAIGGTLTAAVLWFPWAISLAWPGAHLSALTGPAGPVSRALGWGALLRFQTGSIGGAPFGWALVAVAFLPLLVARGRRFGWALRFWSVALVMWALAWASGRGWIGSFAMEPGIVLAFAGASVAVLAGVGAAAFEVDLPGYRFGWRQVATVIAAAGVAAGALPILASSIGGRWNMPAQGYDQTLSWINGQQRVGSYLVLWVGDPATLPLGGWDVQRGLAYAVSENGLPDLAEAWPPADPGALAGLARVIDLVRSGRTVEAGTLLRTFGVRDIVVTTSIAPPLPGVQSGTGQPVPADVAAGFEAQPDLALVSSVGGTLVFANGDWPRVSPGSTHVAAGPRATPATGTPWWRPLEVAGVLAAWATVGWVLFLTRRRFRRRAGP